MEFCILNEIEFKEFSLNHKNRNFWQSVEMTNFRIHNGWKAHYVGVIENETILCAAALVSKPAFMGYEWFQALRGFLIDYENIELLDFFIKELKKYLKENKALYFEMEPYLEYKERDIDGNLVENGFDHSNIVHKLCDEGFIHSGFTIGLDLTKEPRFMFTQDLRGKDEDTLLKNMRKQTRARLKKAISEGVILRELSIEELPVFEKIMEDTGKRKDFDVRELSFYSNFCKAFGEKNIKIILAELDVDDYIARIQNDLKDLEIQLQEMQQILADEKNQTSKNIKKLEVIEQKITAAHKKLEDGETILKEDGNHIQIATAFFITYGREILCLSSGTYTKFAKFNAQYYIRWYMLQYALKHNYERFNFYGLSGDFTPDSIDYGVFEFKKGFDGTVVELVGHFLLPVNKFMFNLYETLRKVKHMIKK